LRLLDRADTHSKVPLCRKRRMYMCAARLRGIVPKGLPRASEQGLPEALGTSTMRILAPVRCYERQSSFCALLSRDACSWAPGCMTTGQLPLLKAPARLGKEERNLGAQADSLGRNRAGYTTA